ncbi:MAG: 3-oxoadipyl-CoA thiolase [Halioglobus sp.]|jgi:acetyl-CoA C-acetyltransferase
MKEDVWIFDGIRTAFGKKGGALASVRGDDLAAAPLRAMVQSNPLPDDAIEDVILGNTNQAGEDSRNLARNAALIAGLAQSVCGMTVNRLCGSGLEALLIGSTTIRAGEADLLLVGGAESMSRAPLVLSRAETAFAGNQQLADSVMGWRFPHPGLLQQHGSDSMAETAENVAIELDIPREACDAFALRSQQLCEAARQRGFFDKEILPIAVPSKRRGEQSISVASDEHPRPDVFAESLANLKPLYVGGVTTAGNASGINDGAAALLIGSEWAANKYGLKPRARVLAGAVAGVPPRVMGLGPVGAIRKVLQRTGLTLDDMDVIEINEAFAAQVLGCMKQLQLREDDPRINPNGGAIALGHPLGASGARLALTAMRQLEATGGRYALVSLCIGIGQGIATIIERV